MPLYNCQCLHSCGEMLALVKQTPSDFRACSDNACIALVFTFKIPLCHEECFLGTMYYVVVSSYTVVSIIINSSSSSSSSWYYY